MSSGFSSSFDDLISSGRRAFDELQGKTADSGSSAVASAPARPPSQMTPTTLARPSLPASDPKAGPDSVVGTAAGVRFKLTPRRG